MFVIDQIDDDIVDYSLGLLEEAKSLDGVKVDVDSTYTFNGIQTTNIEMCYSDAQKLRILKDRFPYQSLHHMHLIEYFEGGYQERHDHKKYEDYTFIIYLNDADGDTLFYFNDETIRVTPKRGQILLFSADILHEGLPSYQSKKVLVGAIILNTDSFKS